MSALPPAPPTLGVEAHKGDAGRVLCLAGSASMPGAALLAVRAAQRAGAGLVTLACFDADLARILPPASPETLYLDLSQSRELFAGRLPHEVRDHRHDVRVAGPGLGARARSRELSECLLEDEAFQGPLVLDADALNVLAGRLEFMNRYSGPLVLTPHPGEAQRLLGTAVPADAEGRVEAAHALARQAQAICVLKGASTVISDGERAAINPSGGPGLATAGSGDVLAGILGAYLTQLDESGVDGKGFELFDAVRSAVYIHGRAGDLAQEQRGVRGLIASDLIEFLPRAQIEHERGVE